MVTKHSERIRSHKRIVVLLGARMYPGKEGLVFPLILPEAQRPHESIVGRTSGGFSRMRGVEGLYQLSDNPKDILTLVTGGQEKGIGSRADEAAKELVSRYGIPAESVVSIGGRGSTIGNAAATVEYLESHKNILGNVRSIDIVTNDYHMLRAWIMFSSGVLSALGTALDVSPEDKEKIRAYLNAGLDEGWEAHKVKETRDAVMRVLEPYFAHSRIKINPVVVEETLEEVAASGDAARGKYAGLLRNNKAMPEVLHSEYKGIMDLLEGHYKGKL